MAEINKRIISSIFMFLILIASIYNAIILTLALLIILFEIYYEFFNLLKKIFTSSKIKLYLASLFVLIYVTSVILLTWQIAINYNDSNSLYLFIIITICVFSDIGGYIFGKTFKGKKLTSISPNKTYSGLIGAYLLSYVMVYFLYNSYLTLSFIAIYTFIISSISQIGDIFISFLKRKSRIKDTGILIPGHGGLLDRLDGIIFALPSGVIISQLI